MNKIINKIFPEISGVGEEKKDTQFWLWLVINSVILLLTSFVIQQLNLKPFTRIADIMEWIVGTYVLVSIIPLRFRSPVFVGSLCIIVFVLFGWFCGVVLLSVALLCFLLLQLPVNVYLKAFLVFGLLAVLAFLRTPIYQMPRVQTVIPDCRGS